MSKLIDFTGHCTVIGKTGSGKTYAARKSLKAQKSPVLFFNTMLVDMPGFVAASKENEWAQIKNRLEKGGKVNYKPAVDRELRNKELVFLIKKLYENHKSVFLAVDEVHLYDKKATESMIEVATTGRHFGVSGVWISQRPANVDNTLMSQSEQFIIFKLNMEGAYMDRYKMPSETINEKIKSGGQYSYIEFDWETVKGPFKV